MADLGRLADEIGVQIFIESPYDQLVNPQTRFWNASGVDLTIDANGLKLQTTSLVPLLLGGIAFATPPESDGAARADENATFFLWSGQADAMRPRETTIETFVIKFTQSVRGLAVGAPVDFRGINAGEVRAIYLEFDPKQVRFLQVVEVHLYPDRLRSRHRAGAPTEAAPAQRIQRFVERFIVQSWVDYLHQRSRRTIAIDSGRCAGARSPGGGARRPISAR